MGNHSKSTPAFSVDRWAIRASLLVVLGIAAAVILWTQVASFGQHPDVDAGPGPTHSGPTTSAPAPPTTAGPSVPGSPLPSGSQPSAGARRPVNGGVTRSPSPTPRPPAPAAVFTARLTVFNEWSTGYNAAVSVHDTGAGAGDWVVLVKLPRDTRVTTTWPVGNASYTSQQSGDTARFSGHLAAGATVTFGYQASRPRSERAEIVSCTVNGIACQR
jgi:hypothetical protein